MKLIAIDLDGTLLGHDKTIHPEDVAAIHEALALGVHVVVATGRHYQDALRMIGQADLHLPIIGSNGASTHDLDGNLVECLGIEPMDLKLIFSELERMEIGFLALGENHVYTLAQGLEIMSDEVERFKTPEFEADMYRIKRELRKMVEEKEGLIFETAEEMALVDDRILNVLSISYDAKKRLEGRSFFEALNRLHVFSSYRNNFEMTHSEVSKGNAVKRFANQLGIKDYEIVAIGDNFNDVSMIKMAGIGVAMGNAEDGVKAISDFVTLPNHEGGVSHAIRKLLFLESNEN